MDRELLTTTWNPLVKSIRAFVESIRAGEDDDRFNVESDEVDDGGASNSDALTEAGKEEGDYRSGLFATTHAGERRELNRRAC